MDTSFLTSMMKTHVKLMQKQLEDGFSLIANKMNTLEEKLAENDSKIANVNQSRDKEHRARQDDDARNKRLFQRLQESIAEQQQSMLQYIDRADQELQKV